MTSVRFEPAAPRSRVEHSTTEPLRSRRAESLNYKLFENYLYKYMMYLMGFFFLTSYVLAEKSYMPICSLFYVFIY